MVAWRMVLCTPEYPEGREMILIANDLTFLIGSFGVREDILFNEASKLARKRKIPRVSVHCLDDLCQIIAKQHIQCSFPRNLKLDF